MRKKLIGLTYLLEGLPNYWLMAKTNYTEDELGLIDIARNMLWWMWRDNFKYFPDTGVTGCVCDWMSGPGYMWEKQAEVDDHLETCPVAQEWQKEHNYVQS